MAVAKKKKRSSSKRKASGKSPETVEAISVVPEPAYYAIINGPNLNLLGTREPEIYGNATLEDIEDAVSALAGELGIAVSFFQSNQEGELIDHVQELPHDCAGIIINAGAYSHTSIALADALRAVAIPYVEVHLSNVFAREGYRHHSFLSDGAMGVMCGFGASSYELALGALLQS